MMRDGKKYNLLGLSTNRISAMKPISREQIKKLKKAKRFVDE